MTLTSTRPRRAVAVAPRSKEQNTYKHLVRCPAGCGHKQLYVKGRGSLTARIVVGTLYSMGWTVEETAADYELPVEVVQECLDYYEHNQEIVDAEVRADRIRGGLDPYEDKPLNPESVGVPQHISG